MVCFDHNLADPSWGGTYRLHDLWEIIRAEAKKYNDWVNEARGDLTYHIEQEKMQSPPRDDYPRSPLQEDKYK